MDDPDDFIELVNNLCMRPRMFTANGTFGEIVAYIMGFAAGSQSTPISKRDASHALNHFITTRLRIPGKYAWSSAILLASDNEADAIRHLRELLTEFTTLRKTHSLEWICADAAKQLAEYEEPEPATVWRAFLAARYGATREEIEPLILPHPQASVLWDRTPTPPGVAAQLNLISNSYIVSIVSGSLESGQVTLITELGKIDAHLVDGRWRIDASRIIEMDAANSAANSTPLPE